MIYRLKILNFYLFIFVFAIISEIFPQGKIIGIVRDKDYFVPVIDVVITLTQNNDASKMLVTNTDGTGFFAYNDIPYGSYKLEVSLKGYSGYLIKNISLREDKQEYTFDTIYISSKYKRIDEVTLNTDNPVVNIEVKSKSLNDNSGCKILGTVRDKKDFTPISDAIVNLYHNNDSIRIMGTGTDGTGFFAFNDLSYGSYKIEISYIGYTNYKVNNIVLSESNKSINLDTIKIFSGNYRTDEIVVQDEKPIIEFNDDKKVINVDKIMTSRGGTAIDVLRKLPMVEVDAEDNVSLRGSKNLLILIDNKPMKFSSLRQLPADAIKNVEIITNPSAKYEAEGVTGILNIVLKKSDSKLIGYNGYLYSGFRDNQSYNTGLGINLKKKKWSFFINGGVGNYKYKNNSNSNVTYTQPVSYYDSRSDGNGSNLYYYGGLGVEYELKKDHNIGADAYFNKSKYDNTSNSTNNNYNDLHLLSSFYKNNNKGDGNWDNVSTSLYYSGKFDKIGKELNLDLSYNDSKNDNNSNQLIQYYDSLFFPVNNSFSNQINVTNGKNKNFRIQLDYSNPFNDKTKFETGYKGTFRMDDNDYRSDTMNYNYNKFFINNDVTNHFKLTEYINALYGTFSHKIKNFRFKLGLRLEHTYTKGELITNNTNFTKDYLDLFPTLSLSQKFGLAHEVQLSYSRRITRPMIYRLNPFVNKYNSKFIYIGNPELTPEYSDSYELSYNFFSNIVNITPMAFYRRSTSVISSYSYVNDSNYTVTTYKNSGMGYSYGMDFIISSRALKWWNLNSTFSFYKSKYDANVSEYSSEEGFSWKANIRSSFTFGELFNIEVNYNYTGKRINSNGFNIPMQSLDASINKSFFDKKLTIGVRGEDLFKSTEWGYETTGEGFKRVSNYNWDSRGVYLTLNYNFGNSKEYYKKSKNVKKNDNEKTDTNDQGNR